MSRLLLCIIALLVLPASGLAYSYANPNPKPFGLWLGEVAQQARKMGVSDTILRQALYDVQPQERIIALDRAQPESTRTFRQYLNNVISAHRISEGRRLLEQHKDILGKVYRQYGVQPEVIVALWGIETSYGKVTGNFDVVEALATLAYDGRRSDYFRGELLNALRILQEGHITPNAMDGSWAGAMGQSQFMPSSFINYAVDHNGDGRRDIWNSLPDVFASMANYLSSHGWNPELGWGRAVKLPPKLVAMKDQTKSLQAWRRAGIKLADGSSLPAASVKAKLVIPGHPSEGAYLVYSNYDVVMKWNRSRYFATAVGLLSDKIAGRTN